MPELRFKQIQCVPVPNTSQTQCNVMLYGLDEQCRLWCSTDMDPAWRPVSTAIPGNDLLAGLPKPSVLYGLTLENKLVSSTDGVVWSSAGSESDKVVITGDTLTRLREIANKLVTQDNRATSHPIYAVRERRRIILPEMATDDEIWLTDEGFEASEAEAATCNSIYAETGDDVIKLPSGSEFNRHSYVDIYEFVTGGLTEDGCNRYIEANRHNLCDPQVYVYSGYRHHETIFLQEFLRSLAVTKGENE
jgi:hypothetical protein